LVYPDWLVIMERFKIYDILHHDRICQIRLSLKDHSCIKGIFDQMEGLLIKIKFSAFQQERGGLLQLIFCVDKSDLKRAQKALRESDLKEEDIHILHEAGMVAIYGPHFVERPGIIAVMHNALSSQGVKVLAISTTLSTSFFVIPASEVCRAVDILKQAFEIPRGKL
jgi:aspartokinase